MTTAETAVPSVGHEIELILMRRLARSLAMPIFIVDAQGQLLYCNRPAERILGTRFEEFAGTRREEAYATFAPREQDGTPLDPAQHPLTMARLEREPAHRRYWIRSLDGSSRLIESTAFPLIGQSGRLLGAVGVFWEIAA